MKKIFRLEGLECANCAAKMERDIASLEGVSKATVSFLTTKMVIEGEEEKFETILEAAGRIVRKYEPHVVVR